MLKNEALKLKFKGLIIEQSKREFGINRDRS